MNQLASMADAIRMVLAPPHRAANPFLFAAALAAMIGLIFGIEWLLVLGILFGAFCLFFFRNPERVPSLGADLLLAPADGRVTSIGEAVPPAELGLGDAPMMRVAIFLSVLDVHVNRMPAAGRVLAVARRPGRFVSASLDKASDENERVAMSVALDRGPTIVVVQIAGLIARRILSDAHPDRRFEAGERFGLIRFGSRTDVYFPIGGAPLVRIGQKMVGGETPIARLAADATDPLTPPLAAGGLLA